MLEKIYAGGLCLMHGLALVNKKHGGPEALSFTEVFFVFPLCLGLLVMYSTSDISVTSSKEHFKIS